MTVEYRITPEESKAILLDALASKVAELWKAGDRLVEMLGEDRRLKTYEADLEDALTRWKDAKGT